MLEAFHPRFERRLDLGANVGGTRRMLSNEHDRETRRSASSLAESSSDIRNPPTKVGSRCLAVNDPRGHAPM
jgi:hypothetical protein